MTGSTRYFDKIDDNKTFNEPQSILFNKICKLFIYKDLTDFTSGYTCIRKTFLITINKKRILWRIFFRFNFLL